MKTYVKIFGYLIIILKIFCKVFYIQILKVIEIWMMVVIQNATIVGFIEL
jgi:hypothetical protein